MQEHDELSIHGNADVISEFSHYTALHFGLAARIYTHTYRNNSLTTTTRHKKVCVFSRL